MTAFLPNAPGGASTFAQSDRSDLAPSKPRIVAVEQAPKTTHSYRFNQLLFPLDDGRTLLRLHYPLTLLLDKRTMQFEVKDWGVHMDTAQAYDLPRQIARRFLTFFGKADSQSLTEPEKLEWLRICDQVDVAHFNADRSAPHYAEGTLKKKNPLAVEWHDGVRENLPSRLAANFHPLEEGDNFSAFIKMGKGNETLNIERVSILPA
jgi:hypothetical protein